MLAVVTSIGEPTTKLCVWALERNGFDVILLDNPEQTLWQKLKHIYETVEEDVLRVDADTVVNANCTPEYFYALDKEVWWWQGKVFDWFKQDIAHGGLQFYRKKALDILQKRVDDFAQFNRPETELSRIEELYNPRRFESVDVVMGLNNYLNDMDRVRKVKRERDQEELYDWELAERIGEL